MDEQEIIAIKFGGQPGETEWTYGLHYRITVHTPVRRTLMVACPEAPDTYQPVEFTDHIVFETNVTRRARLSDLTELVVQALDRGHEFVVDFMDDGRSDPRGYSQLSAHDFTTLLKTVYEIQKGAVD